MVLVLSLRRDIICAGSDSRVALGEMDCWCIRVLFEAEVKGYQWF
jgi:hypothetical protein